MVRMVPYTHEYYDDVMRCVARSDIGRGNPSFLTEDSGLKSLLLFNPTENLPEKAMKYMRGGVILSEDKLVGYMGGTSSLRHIGDKSYSYMAFTSWAIEKPYRLYQFRFLKELHEAFDVVVDFSARDSVYNYMTKLYGYEIMDSVKYRFCPLPYNGIDRISFYTMKESDFIDENERILYHDNKSYDVYCAKITDSEKHKGLIYYKHMHSNGDWIRIIRTTDDAGMLFAQYADEIVWYIYKSLGLYANEDTALNQIIKDQYNHKWISLECDSRFIGDYKIRHPLYNTKAVRRLTLDKTGIDNREMDFLGTEFAISDFAD